MTRRIQKIDKHEEALEKEGKMLPASLARERQSLTMDLFAITTRMEQQKKEGSKAPKTVEVIFADTPKKELK